MIGGVLARLHHLSGPSQNLLIYLFWVLKKLNETNWGQVNFAINSHYSDEVKREHVESVSLKKVYAEYGREREEKLRTNG